MRSSKSQITIFRFNPDKNSDPHNEDPTFNYAAAEVPGKLHSKDVHFFFPETTTYTAVSGEITLPKRYPESFMGCPQRMSLTQSGRLCYAYVTDLCILSITY